MRYPTAVFHHPHTKAPIHALDAGIGHDWHRLLCRQCYCHFRQFTNRRQYLGDCCKRNLGQDFFCDGIGMGFNAQHLSRQQVTGTRAQDDLCRKLGA